MRLWTWQFEETSPLVEKIDPRGPGSYYETKPELRPHLEKLWKHLETGQLVWCFTDQDDAKEPWPGRRRWELNVPAEEVSWVIDPSIWERIIGRNAFPRTKVKDWCVSQERYPIGEAVDDFLDSYKSIPAPDGDWWSELFLNDCDTESWTQRWLDSHCGPEAILAPRCQVLLKRPAETDWIMA